MDSSERFKCDQCGKIFPSLGRFNQHLKTHTKPYSCEECDKTFALRADLARHVHARHRTGQNMHACVAYQCNFKATRKDNIRQHLRNAHPEYSLPPRSRRRKQEPTSGSLALLLAPSAAQEDVEGAQRHAALPTLMQAARTGNFGLVQAILHLGIHVSIQADDGSTALHCAARADQTEMIQYLLTAGAKADIANNRNRTPLHETVFGKCHQAFVLLLQNGSNISQTILEDIIKHEEKQLLEAALAVLGEVFIELHGQHLFKCAVKYNSVSSIATLISSTKIDRSWIGSEGGEIVFYAVLYQRVAIVKYLLDSNQLDPNLLVGRQKERRKDTSLLQVAAGCGHLEIVKLLLACKGIDVNRRNFRGHSSLHKAAARGKYEVVDVLLQREDISVSHEDQRALKEKELHVAAWGGHTIVFESILVHLDRKHVSIDQLDSHGRTPIEVAVAGGSFDIVKLLLSTRSISYKRSNSIGRSLLKLAVQNGQLQILKLLLENNQIDLARYSKLRHKLLKQAVLGFYWQIVGFLLEHQKPAKKYRDDRTWDVGGAKQNARTVKWFLDEEPLSINLLDAGGTSLLSKAVQGNDVAITALLLDHDSVEVNLPNDNGKAPLHFAVEKPHALDSLQLLLDHQGVRVNQMDDLGNTAMQLAVLGKNFGAAKLICQHRDFDPNIRMKRGLFVGPTALEYARDRGYDEFVGLLLEYGAEDLESLGEVPLGAAFEEASECENPQHLLGLGSEAKVSDTAGSISWNTNRAIQAMATGDEDMENSTDLAAHEIGVHGYESGTDQDMADGQDDGEEYWGPYGLSRP